MTKFTLLAAASVVAMAFAGAANAGQVTGTINGVAFDPQNATPANRTIYTIASERTNAADTTPAGGFVAALALTNKPSISVGSGSQSYQVTFTVTGGTIPTASAASLVVNQTAVGGATLGTTSVAQGARDANSITFIVTVNAPTVAGSATVDGFTLTGVLANSASEASVTLATSTSVLAGGVSSVIDTTSAQTIVRYASAVGSLAVTSNNAVAALPDFKLFSAGPAPAATISNGGRTAEIASNFLYTASTTNNSGGAFYAGLAANTAVTRADIINGGVVGFAGSIPTNMTVVLEGVTGGNITTTAVNANSAVFTLNNAGADEFIAGTADVTLTQPVTAADRNAIPAGFYTTTFAPTYAAGYTAPAATTLPSGNITLDGVNFIAPWINGPQAPGQTVIRMSNGGSAASGAVTLRLNNAQARAAGVTTGAGSPIANQTCATTYSIPANGELQITGTQLASCFGQFLRGDLQITVQSTSTALTAKARNVAADGTTFEQSLGRFSGGTAADATF